MGRVVSQVGGVVSHVGGVVSHVGGVVSQVGGVVSQVGGVVSHVGGVVSQVGVVGSLVVGYYCEQCEVSSKGSRCSKCDGQCEYANHDKFSMHWSHPCTSGVQYMTGVTRALVGCST